MAFVTLLTPLPHLHQQQPRCQYRPAVSACQCTAVESSSTSRSAHNSTSQQSSAARPPGANIHRHVINCVISRYDRRYSSRTLASHPQAPTPAPHPHHHYCATPSATQRQSDSRLASQAAVWPQSHSSLLAKPGILDNTWRHCSSSSTHKTSQPSQAPGARPQKTSRQHKTRYKTACSRLQLSI